MLDVFLSFDGGSTFSGTPDLTSTGFKQIISNTHSSINLKLSLGIFVENVTDEHLEFTTGTTGTTVPRGKLFLTQVNFTETPSTSAIPVPELATMILLGIGFVYLLGVGARR